VVVASDSGRTAVKFCEALKGAARVVAVSWKDMEPESLKKLRKMGAEVIERCHTPLSTDEAKTFRDALYTLGQGFKVAVEVAIIAADRGLIPVGKEVIAVGGTETGADTAIVVKASTTGEMLGPDFERRLAVTEVIAMPRKKKWWE